MMKATALEFRFRFLLHAVLYGIGFAAPWNLIVHYDTIRTWQLLAAFAARQGLLGFSAATVAVLVAGIVFSALGAGLRTWGSAYLGAWIVGDGGMHGDVVVAAGPYRYVRNPLYLGTFLHTLALALLMPPTGAVFAIVTVGILQLRLIGAEEEFLGRRLGESYRSYCAEVPSLMPRLRMVPEARMNVSTVRPRWGSAFAGELYFWGAAVSFAALGWRYNALLVLQGVIISLGLSLVARAFVVKK